jgi:hypothetical protein
MKHSAEFFFCTARYQNTNVSAFVAAVQATVYKKDLGDLAYLMAVK